METLQTLAIDWLSHDEWWFKSTSVTDRTLADRFAHLLETAPSHAPSIGTIILYDQLPHHFYRQEPASHVISYFLSKALNARAALRAPSTIREFIFYQLPQRHTNDPVLIHDVMSDAWQRLVSGSFSSTDPDYPMLRRFLKATYDRCPQTSIPFLHCHMPDHIEACIALARHDDPIRNAVLAAISDVTHPIIVSLSGGVDSMILLSAMCHVRGNTGVIAVHINYENRATTGEEETFVIDYCKKLGIALFVRRLGEISRPRAMQFEMREVYESYTRNQRYATYKDVASMFHDRDADVFMGHNMDDTIENILTNVVQQNKYDNLRGMRNIETVSGIRFHRPLLKISKDEICKYAYHHNIPHLPNSTPPWSQRGKIRDVVLPTLMGWDPRAIHGLQKLADHMCDLGYLAERHIAACVQRTMSTPSGHSIVFERHDTPPHSPFFWRMLLQATTGGQYVSYKALNMLKIRMVQMAQRDCTGFKIPLKKGLVMSVSYRSDKGYQFAW